MPQRSDYDVAIAGLGAVGSAAAWQLARRGRRVLGLDRFDPPHALGSSHGRTRIIREAYFEHPLYVPLIQRAYEKWAELERVAGRPLLRLTGGLMLGPPDGMLLSGTRASARAHGLAHEELTAAEVRRRFPGLAPRDDMVGILEPSGGLLFPEACIHSSLELAARAGAELHSTEPLLHWRAESGGAVIETARGRYRAARLILAAGAWLPELLAALGLPLQVERQFMHWFRPAAFPQRFHADHCPIVLWEYEPERIFATLPDVGDGLKLAIHHEGVATDPESVDRRISADEERKVRGLLDAYLPDAHGELLDAAVCLYTNTPDYDFLLDFHPEQPQVILASACSGHGFKFASALGEILADLADGAATRFDLTPFCAARFAGRGATAHHGAACAPRRRETDRPEPP
ncbi:MAG: N-methyl-L-tryptophan oxidase [Gemmatimonadetes bacterium]|nr:N-methyl-L-tryptophan oxidase [Gemmatimonadota bacterium]